MLNVAYLPKDFAIGCYVPLWQWPEDGPPDHYTGFIAAIKGIFDGTDPCLKNQAIEEAVEFLSSNLYGFDAVAVVPSHKAAKTSSTGIYRIAAELSRQSSERIVDATACLHRIKDIKKLAESKGKRSMQTHLDSIQLRHSQRLKDKRILLLDDVRCSGSSLDACVQILNNEALPTAVYPLALAQSWYDGMEDFEQAYAHIDFEIHRDYQVQKEILNIEKDQERDALGNLQRFAFGH